VSVLLCETGIVLSHATTGDAETGLIYIIVECVDVMASLSSQVFQNQESPLGVWV